MDLPADHLAAWALAMDQGERDRSVPTKVRILGREGDQLGVELTRDLAEAAEAELFADGRVYALAGGAPLVRWLLRDRWPAGLTTIALRAVEASTLTTLVDAPVLDRVRSLILVDAPARASAVTRLLAGSWRSLESLAIFDATQRSIDALARLPLLRRLGVLRVIGPLDGRQPGELAALLAGDRRATETLDLENLLLDSEACEALARGDWSGLRSLRIDDCSVPDRGAALVDAPLGGLRELRVTRRRRGLGAVLGDAAISALVSRSPELRIAGLAGSDAGDATAFALAKYGARLEVLDLEGCPIGDAGAIALGESSVFAGLKTLTLSAPLGFDAAYALADSRSPAVAKAGRREHRAVSALRSWRPRAPEPGPPGPWPEAALARRFRWQFHDDCETCDGREICPDGWCAYHRETEVHPVEYGDRPPTAAARGWIAGLGELVLAVERHAAAMLSALAAMGRWRGEPRVTWWVLDDKHRGCDHDPFKAPVAFRELIAAVGAPELSDTAVWAHACARARARDFPELPDPFTPARAIADLGVMILGLTEEDGLLLRVGPGRDR